MSRFCFLIAVLGVPLGLSAQPADSGLINVGDSTIEYISQGQGEPVVMLPGAGLSVNYLEGMAQALADSGFRAIRINFRGAGRSTGPDQGVTLHTLSADIAALVVALKIGPANLLGHAFGNRVARTLAADRPELVRSVILFAAGGKFPPQPLSGKGSPEEQRKERMLRLVGDPSEIEIVSKSLQGSDAPRAYQIQTAAIRATPIEDWWAPPGKTKFLVVQGSNDKTAPPANGEDLKRVLGDRVTLISIPGAGHVMVITELKKSIDAVVSFLRSQAR